MLIQVFITTFLFAANILPFLGFALLAVLIMIAGPFVVGLVWVATLIVALAGILARPPRPPRVQPDGWVEAKMPTSAMLAASIVAGLPTLVIYATLYLLIRQGIDDGYSHTTVFNSMLLACDLVEALIAVGIFYLLRRSKALDPLVRVS